MFKLTSMTLENYGKTPQLRLSFNGQDENIGEHVSFNCDDAQANRVLAVAYEIFRERQASLVASLTKAQTPALLEHIPAADFTEVDDDLPF